MKIKNILIAYLLMQNIFADVSLDPAFNKKTKVILKIVDENNVAIEGVEYWVWYRNPFAPNGEGYEFVGETDAEGTLHTKAVSPFGVLVRLQKEGYYSYGAGVAEDYRILPQPLVYENTIVLRKVLNPIPLYAKQGLKYGEAYRIPVKGEWIGFDFEQGDWLKPYGKGRQSDILFRYQNEFMGFRKSSTRSMEQRRASYQRKCNNKGIPFTEEGFREAIGNWNGILEISFPGEKEGILKVEEAFIPQSELHMPHKAPVDGYFEKYSYVVDYKESVKPRNDIGFFLRTRVVLDENDEIKSANYAKIYGEFDFSPIGLVDFTYYFNPEVNDRNLEFDIGSNLFKEEQIILP